MLGVVGVLYGALLAFAQDDVKRLIAYTSVSHMGFVLLGLFAGSGLAFQGAMIQIVSHGLARGPSSSSQARSRSGFVPAP